MEYTDFVTWLSLMMEVDPTTDLDWPNFLPAAIEAAEFRCYRDLDPLAARAREVLTTTAGTATLSLPANLSVPRELALQAVPAGASSGHLAQRDPTFLGELYPPGTAQGTPKYWAFTAEAVGGGTVMLGPIPNGAFSVAVDYTSLPAALSADNTPTWLSTWCPDLMLYAAMVFASGYQQNYGAQSDNPQQSASWEAQYQTALAAALRDEARRKGHDYFDASRSAPPSSDAPTGATANR